MREPGGAATYPAHLEAAVVLRDGKTARLRPVHPDDGPALSALHGRMSKEAIYFRYFNARRILPQRQLDAFTHLDYRDRMGFVVECGGAVVGHACYHRRPLERSAEVAFEVQDDHWGRGIATILLRHLAVTARDCGIEFLTAHVLPDNHRMLDVFRYAGLTERRYFEDGTIGVELSLRASGDPTTDLPD